MRWRLPLVTLVALGAAAVYSVSAAPRLVRRSAGETVGDGDGGEAASSYFFFSRTPTKAFFPAPVLKDVAEFGPADALDASEFGKAPVASAESDEHEAYRVLEEEEEEEHDGDGDGRHGQAGGHSYEAGHRARQGAHGERGYDSRQAVEQASAGSHGREEHAHRYAQDGARKRAHHDEAAHYHDQHREAKRTRGGKHHEKKHHKKGSKTTGYHNVYHKDEYKKEHVFYDTSDHEGQFRKYGSAHEHHSAAAGRRGAGGHEERAHQQTGHRKAASMDRGRYDDRHAHHLHRHGQQQHDRTGAQFEQHRGHAGAADTGYNIIHH